MKVIVCVFFLNDDICLLIFIIFVGYLLRNFWVGFVQCWDLNSCEDEGGYDDSFFIYLFCFLCCFLFNGEIVFYILNIGNGYIILVEIILDGSFEFFKIDCVIVGYGEKSLFFRVLFCVFFFDGLKVVIVSNVILEFYRGIEINEICLW